MGENTNLRSADDVHKSEVHTHQPVDKFSKVPYYSAFLLSWKLPMFCLGLGILVVLYLFNGDVSQHSLLAWAQPYTHQRTPVNIMNQQTPMKERQIQRKFKHEENQVYSPVDAEQSNAEQNGPYNEIANTDVDTHNVKSRHSREKKIRLNFYGKPWKDVLQDVSEDFGTSLVLHNVPHQRLTRSDWNKYGRADSVRILNDELQKIGYRLLEKENHWTVISTKRTTISYPRQVVKQKPYSLPHGKSIIPVPHPSPNLKVANGYQGGMPTGNYTPINFVKPENDVSNQTQPAFFPGVHTKEFTEAEETVLSNAVVYTPANLHVKEISRKIYQASKERAELVKDETKQYPTFRVYTHAKDTNKAPLFEIGIDLDANRLLISGSQQVTKQVIQLAGFVDEKSDENQSPAVLVDVKSDATSIEKQLTPLLEKSHVIEFLKKNNRLTNKQVAGYLQEKDFQATQKNGQNTKSTTQNSNNSSQPGSPPLPQDATEIVKDQLPSLLEKLQGDVTIESLPDLNFLILRGNEKDVESVVNMIKSIEQLAVGSVPGIHLQYLRNVNSEALATLLNDVYTQLATIKNRNTTNANVNVAVIPVVKPNAILVLAPENILESVLQLTDELDQPVNPAFEVQVFFLKHANALEVQTLVEGFYENRTPLGARVLITSDARTNAIVIQARPSDLLEVARLVAKIDRDRAASKGQVKIFRLKYTVAEEMATYLNSIINSVLTPSSQNQQGGGGFGFGGGTQQFQQAKSMILELLTKNENMQKLVKSGVLVDIRISSDPRSNTLTVTAPAHSVNFVTELVNILDQPPSVTSEIKIYKLTYADATSAVDLLNVLFAANTTTQQNTVQIQGAENASVLVPVKLSVDIRTNSVVASGSPETLKIVQAILLRLDESGIRERKTAVYKLRNRDVTLITDSLNTFLEEQRALFDISPDLVSTNELLEQEIIVTPEATTNSVIISATPRYFDRIMSMINQLDQEPGQVLIQGLIVEVQLDDTDELGVELGFQDSVLFGRSDAANVPGFLFNNQQLGNAIFNPGSIGTQGLSAFALGRTNADLGFGGLVLSASSDEVSVLIRALASQRNVNILSRPQVLVTDNQTAQIQVGQQVPIVNGVNITATGVANPNIIQDEAGIILTVTPRINPEGLIVMETVAEKSSFSGAGVPIFTDVTTGNVVTSPIKEITTARSTIRVTDGQTIIMGGMITKEDEVQVRKVPHLGDLPYIGKAFRYDSFVSERRELLIFITPRIIHHDCDMETIKQIEVDRLNFFVDDAEQVHGPIFGVPGQNGLPVYEGGYCPPGEQPYYENGNLSPVPQEEMAPLIDPLLPPQSSNTTKTTGNSYQGKIETVSHETVATPKKRKRLIFKNGIFQKQGDSK